MTCSVRFHSVSLLEHSSTKKQRERGDKKRAVIDSWLRERMIKKTKVMRSNRELPVRMSEAMSKRLNNRKVTLVEHIEHTFDKFPHFSTLGVDSVVEC